MGEKDAMDCGKEHCGACCGGLCAASASCGTFPCGVSDARPCDEDGTCWRDADGTVPCNVSNARPCDKDGACWRDADGTFSCSVSNARPCNEGGVCCRDEDAAFPYSASYAQALSEVERELLLLLAQIPFLPIARREEDGRPVLLANGIGKEIGDPGTDGADGSRAPADPNDPSGRPDLSDSRNSFGPSEPDRRSGPLEEYGEAMASLTRKGLVSLDYGIPLPNFPYDEYGPFACRGSMALTEAGQDALDWM